MTYYHHAVVDSPQIPRDLDSSSAQSVIITLLGELWPLGEPARVPSMAIADILSSIGISETATRSALSRMQRNGTLDLHKSGRRTLYSIAGEVATSIPGSTELTMGFGDSSRPWSGDWTVVVFSLPESQRAVRQNLRDKLRWLGFGPLRDGVWVAPRCEATTALAELGDLLPDNAVVLRSQEFFGAVDVETAWPLEPVRDAYASFIEDFRPYMFSLRASTVAPTEAFRVWTSLLGRWRAFPTMDPDLPASQMPADWPQREARRTFIAVHDGCTPLVQSLVRSIVERYDPRLAEDARAVPVAEALAHARGYLAALRDEKRAAGSVPMRPSTVG
ncbi:PaaX family transcriptional regulator [Microbacterium sp. RD1]|uniref:PaaX family transcriptional regulator n=1 Tax=Microbacterium sp. RD1 TaxID=3457313 RepID=UPI003FA5A157